MTEEESFLQSIRDDAGDDTVRLVYADWLEEHGQLERAEFIRVQCELAKTECDNPRYPNLKGRSDELESENGTRWAGPISELSIYTADFHRGFIDRVSLYCSDDQEALRPLRSTMNNNVVTELEYHLSFGYLPENQNAQLLSRLGDWHEARSLRKLALDYDRSSDDSGWFEEDIELLSSNPNLSNLVSLDLSPSVSPAQLSRLGRGVFATTLKRFRAKMGRKIDPKEWCEHWKWLPFISQLTELDVNIDWHTDESLALMLAADLRDIQSLDIRCNDVTEAAFDILHRWPRMRQVRKLKLTSNNLGSQLLSRLIELPADRLHVLEIGGEMYRNRVHGTFFSREQTLDQDSFVPFANSRMAQRLTELTLMEIEPGEPLIRALSEAPMPMLSILFINSINCDHDDYRKLFSAKWIRQLKSLNLIHCSMTDDDVQLILDGSYHPAVNIWLSFHGNNNQVSDEMKVKLRKRFGSRIQISPE
jgi:uncharacterized protein (TIGR02996 family)